MAVVADNIGAWQITLRVADNICGLSISYREKNSKCNLIGLFYSYSVTAYSSFKLRNEIQRVIGRKI